MSETTVPSNKPEVSEIAYNAAVRTIEHQDAQVDSLRDRALQLAGFAGASTAVAASAALLSDQRVSVATTVALASATAVLLYLLCHVWKMNKLVSGWRIEQDARHILEDYAEFDADDAYKKLAEYLASDWAENKVKLDDLRHHYNLVWAASGLEVVLWVLTAWSAVLT